MYNPHFKEGYMMVKHLVDRHAEEIYGLDFWYEILKYTSATGEVIELPTPRLWMDFKR